MLKPNQKAWIEDNYDLIDWAVAEFSESDSEEDREEIRSYASLLMCESLDEFELIVDERQFCRWVFKKVIPLHKKYMRLLMDVEIPMFNNDVDRADYGRGYYEE